MEDHLANEDEMIGRKDDLDFDLEDAKGGINPLNLFLTEGAGTTCETRAKCFDCETRRTMGHKPLCNQLESLWRMSPKLCWRMTSI